jgi:hypothetical protein
VPSAPINREANQPKVLQHTFSNLAKCVAIFFMFWQVAVRRACSPAFFNPLNRQITVVAFQEETKNQYILQSYEEDGHQVLIHQSIQIHIHFGYNFLDLILVTPLF